MGDNTDKLVVGLLAGLVVLVVIPMVAMGPMVTMGSWMVGEGHMGSGAGGGSGWVTIAGAAMQLLVVLAVAVGIYLLYHGLYSSDSEDDALEALRLAYARGDLSQEEYETRRQRLEDDS